MTLPRKKKSHPTEEAEQTKSIKPYLEITKPRERRPKKEELQTIPEKARGDASLDTMSGGRERPKP